MTVRHVVVVVALSGWLCLAINPRLLADNQHENHDVPVGLLKAVQDATRGFFDVNAATAAGYGSLGSCVTGPERGAMGIHYGNSGLVGDGLIDASAPELLIYEQRGRRSHFRPVMDIARITRMIAWKLFVRGLDLPGLVRSLRGPQPR